MQECVFGHMQTVPAQISLCIHYDNRLHCLLTESLATTECTNGKQWPI